MVAKDFCFHQQFRCARELLDNTTRAPSRTWLSMPKVRGENSQSRATFGENQGGGGGLKKTDNNKILWVSCYCWWFRNPANRLRLVVFFPLFTRFVLNPRWLFFGFLNHQQYHAGYTAFVGLYIFLNEWIPGAAKIWSDWFFVLQKWRGVTPKKHIHGKTNSVICLCLWILSLWTKFWLTTWGWLYSL